MTPGNEQAGRNMAESLASGSSTSGNGRPGPTVVVGIDGLEPSRAALEWGSAPPIA